MSKLLLTTSASLAGGMCAVALALCPPMPESPLEDGRFAVQLEQSWAVLAPDDERTSVRPEPARSSNPGLDGVWLAPTPWEVIAIHAALLPTGEVLHYSYPAGGEGSRARLWNPGTGNFTLVDWNDDLFCSGLSLLPDGTVYVTGGNDTSGCDFRGIRDTNVFSPFTNQWTALEEMQDGRWYPTNITLADGRVLIFSGNDLTCDNNAEVELYTPGKGLEAVPEGHRYLALYPRMHLLTSGKIAHVGPENEAWTFELRTGWEFIAPSNIWRSQGTSVLIPGRTDEIMVIGGANGPFVQSTCQIIDFGEPEPSFRATGALNHARAHADALILPDRNVLLMGGGQLDLYEEPVNIPELYDPDTETWTELAPHVFGRMYHATTLLLPDARVLVAGQDNGDGAFTGEIYMPPYLFRGARPTISDAPPQVYYDRGFDVETPDAGSIASAVLIRLTSVTHSVNFEQRLLDLPFTNTDDGIRAIAPAGPGFAPPGFYMLFILNANEAPSVARIVHLAPWRTGDVTNDGIVDFADIVALLGAWGDCPPPPAECAADVNRDGVVDFEDLLTILANWS